MTRRPARLLRCLVLALAAAVVPRPETACASPTPQSGLGRDATASLDSLALTPVESSVSARAAADRAGVGPALVRIEDLLGDRLSAALSASRKFTLVARERLGAALAEQAFAASGLVDPADPAAARAMKVAGVRWLAVPRVIDFDDAVRTRRFPGLDREVARRTIRLVATLEILDSTTGVVAETSAVTVEATDTADEDTRALPEGTPPTAVLIDRLAREAAVELACRLVDTAYPATVLAANASTITINRGSGGCLAAGDRWIATSRGEALVDPDTGAVLGFDERDRGILEVTRVEARLARARVIAGTVAPGDVLRPLPDGADPGSIVLDAGDDWTETLVPAGVGGSTPTGPRQNDSVASAVLRELGPVAVFTVSSGSTPDPALLKALRSEVAGAVAGVGVQVVEAEDVVVDPGNGTDATTPDASRLRLAEAVGARWALVVSLGSDDARRTRTVVGNDTFEALVREVRGNWRLVATSDAAAVAGDRFQGRGTRLEASRGSGPAVETDRPLQREAVTAAATDLAGTLVEAAPEIARARVATPAGEGVIRVEASLDGLVVPEIVQGPDGAWRVTATRLPVIVGDVEVAIDGFVVGSTPGTIKVANGPHRLALSRQGVEPWNRAIRVLGAGGEDPQVIRVGLRPTAEARSRYLENAVVVRDLEANALLTEAQVDAMRGFATFLRQSGYRVDERRSEDIRIDSDEVPEVLQWNSFWSRW